MKLGKGRELPEETVKAKRVAKPKTEPVIGADGQAVIVKKPLRAKKTGDETVEETADARPAAPRSSSPSPSSSAAEPPIVAKPAAEIAAEPPRIAPVAPAPAPPPAPAPTETMKPAAAAPPAPLSPAPAPAAPGAASPSRRSFRSGRWSVVAAATPAVAPVAPSGGTVLAATHHAGAASSGGAAAASASGSAAWRRPRQPVRRRRHAAAPGSAGRVIRPAAAAVEPPPPPPPPVEVKRELVRVPESVTVAELAEKMRRKSGEVIKALIELGVMKMVNDLLDPTEAKLVADKFSFDLEIRSVEGEVIEEEEAGTTRASCSCGRRSSPSWATSTTARRRCSTPSGAPRWPRRSTAASPSTSAPTRW